MMRHQAASQNLLPTLALLLASLAAAFAPLSAHGAAAATESGAFGEDMDLEADRIEFVMTGGDIQSMQAFGSVRMVSETMNIQCETLTLDPSTNKVNAEAGSQKKVIVKMEGMEAECGSLEHDLSTGNTLLKKGATIVQEGGQTSGENITIVKSEGGGQSILVESGNQNLIMRSSEAPGAQSRATPNPQQNVREMRGNFNVTEAEAARLVLGDNKPATLEIPTGQSEPSQPVNRPPSGRITSDNVNQIPDKTSSRPLETAE